MNGEQIEREFVKILKELEWIDDAFFGDNEASIRETVHDLYYEVYKLRAHVNEITGVL